MSERMRFLGVAAALLCLTAIIGGCISGGSASEVEETQPAESAPAEAAGPATAAPTAEPTKPTAPTAAPTTAPTEPPIPTALPTTVPTEPSTPTAAPTITPTPTQAIHQESIEAAYEDRVIRGTLVGEGDTAVVLAPMIDHSRSSWMPFAEHLATQGFTALAFDFPGSGTSSGEFSWSSPPFDVVAVIDFLRERGYERIVCMGASLGAFGCFKAAVLRPDLAGLVIIADGITATTGEEAATLLMPKLFVRGRDANNVVKAMQDVYQLVSTPKEFVTLSAPAHGTNLFDSDDKDEFRDLLVEFLESIQ